MLMWAMISLLGMGVRAQEDKGAGDPLKKDSEALQGKWERVLTTDTSNALGTAKRAVKETKGDREMVTWYGDGANHPRLLDRLVRELRGCKRQVSGGSGSRTGKKGTAQIAAK
jgi:hypothetical protein